MPKITKEESLARRNEIIDACEALYQAESVQDAIRLRLEHPEAQIIAGGTDVLVQMREGKRAGKAPQKAGGAASLAHHRGARRRPAAANSAAPPHPACPVRALGTGAGAGT